MFIYFHYTKNGNQTLQAFHKADKAAEFVINQITSYAADEGKNVKGQQKKSAVNRYVANAIDWGNGDIEAPQPVIAVPPPPPFPQFIEQAQQAPQAETKVEESRKIPIELEKLKAHMEVAKKNKTFENATKAIHLYEDFLKYALNAESPIHTLTDVKIVE